ncbi:FAD binding domain-containing protein [Nannizzia gypsea CBS 118893]|uniref:FAD binding domain-containing protein n=1 Tax=Arthroderma gypseum (strain ATCC MYA-4604 / CBS 118893) TaxID=535722 RepID=E4UVF4_ARTGP|nr:FAD binding domain-containing protein [Nannizzia gypsea CBS 118893]EFR02281.1 FAD binding domain-containing protein [Nannizzia gypsea CBS 118893]
MHSIALKAAVALLGVSTVAGFSWQNNRLCLKLAAQGVEVDFPNTTDYETEQLNYWSAACTALRPDCIIAPKNAQDMAKAVAAIKKSNTTRFAIKSGGHSPNQLFSSIHDGVLISTRNLKQITYDKNTQTAVLGPGLRWEEAVGGLKQYGQTVVGGRLGGIGVGGLLLGGGLSFLSSQYGWAANNVVNFEVVLANGTIVNANAKSNPDLYAVMKGGSGNFGIVTAFTVKTHTQDPEIWGGTMFIQEAHSEAVTRAIRDFAEYNNDDKASIIGTVNRNPSLIWVVFLTYDGPSPPEMYSEISLRSQLFEILSRDRVIHSLMLANDEYIHHGSRFAISAETASPIRPARLRYFQVFLFDPLNNVTDQFIGIPSSASSFVLQPLPRSITTKAKESGGDVAGFDPKFDYMLMQIAISWNSSSSDAAIEKANRKYYTLQGEMIKQYTNEGKLPKAYTPLYLNDLNAEQDFWGRVAPSTRQKAQAVRRAVDPDLFFQDRATGVFRLG